MPDESVLIDGDRIRRFTNSKLQESIDRALAELKDGERGAVLAYGNGDGVNLAAVARLGDQWSVVGVLSHEWKGPKPLDGEVAIRFKW